MLRDSATVVADRVERRLRDLDGTVARTYIETVYTTRGSPSGAGRVRRSGGPIGAAAGGIRSNMTLVGEEGPELVDLPTGSRVWPASNTGQMLGGGGGPNIYLTVNVQGSVTSERDLVGVITDHLRSGGMDGIGLAGGRR
jgi:hypothetical protein